MIYLYILAMALTTYLIRMLPLTIFKKEIKNRYIKAFLKFIPVCCLTAMTVPSIFTSTSYLVSGIAAFATAVILALCRRSLVVVAAGASAAVFTTEIILKYILG